MHVRLTLRSDRLADAGPEIRARASDIWAREGVTLSWQEDGLDGPPSWQVVDLWVLVRHQPARLGDPMAIGAVAFDGGAPGRVATISVDAAIRWVHAEVAGRFSTVERHSPNAWLGNTRELLIPTLAVAIAHEIGHVVLASRRHAREGLMAEALVGPTALAARSTVLDVPNRSRLVQRLALAAQCPAPLVPSGAGRRDDPPPVSGRR
jgi:hypothetical protein